jgi:DNA-binding transcriptional ArsR family regulator
MSEAEAPYFTFTAALLADPARALMLTRLLDGGALPAGELAYAAGVTPQTASSHLAKLVGGGLLEVDRQGRHRYYRLAGPHVAQALEHFAAIHPPPAARRKALSPEGRRLRFCRCCYDHLAGQMGVALARGLQDRGFIIAEERFFRVTPLGVQWFAELGVHVTLSGSGELAKRCLDWTERVHHVGGPLGVRLLQAMCGKGWLRRTPGSRLVVVTPSGRDAFKAQFGFDQISLGLDQASPADGARAAPSAESVA